MTELVFRISLIYFLGIIGTLLTITWFASKKFSSLETSINWIKKELSKHWGEIKEMKRDVGDFRLAMAGLEKGRSPLAPTDKGWGYLKGSGLVDIIDKTHRELLLGKLKENLPQKHAGYDVQEMARQVMLGMKDDPIMKSVKEYALNSGISVDLLLLTSGLLLRDNFLGWKHEIAKK